MNLSGHFIFKTVSDAFIPSVMWRWAGAGVGVTDICRKLHSDKNTCDTHTLKSAFSSAVIITHTHTHSNVQTPPKREVQDLAKRGAL